MGEDRELTLGQLYLAYWLQMIIAPPPRFHITPLWKAFTGDEECNTQHMTADHLHFSSLRYLQQFFRFTLFWCAEPQSCQKQEIFLMVSYLFSQFDKENLSETTFYNHFFVRNHLVKKNWLISHLFSSFFV